MDQLLWLGLSLWRFTEVVGTSVDVFWQLSFIRWQFHTRLQCILVLFTPGSPLPLPLGVSQHVPFHLLILSYCVLCSSPLFFFVTQQVQLMLPAGTLSVDVSLTLCRSRAGSYRELLSRHVQKTALHSILLHPLAFPSFSFPRPWCHLSSRGWRCPTLGWALTVLYSQHLPSCYIDRRRKLLWPRLKALISGYKHN